MQCLMLWLVLSIAQIAEAMQVSGVSVHKVFLRQNDPTCAYCLAVSSAMEVMQRPGTNFLATQVWPSARTAAAAIYEHANPQWSICEFGCGPGLPSLTAAKMGARNVYATDVDDLALELVKAAAEGQGLLDRIETRRFDLLAPTNENDDDGMPHADLYTLSDVFESASVARGAALVSQQAIKRGSRVWVFAQSDRAQREVYLEEMKKVLQDTSLAWSPPQLGPPKDAKLWLCDIDETTVKYG
jgi:SAM-dependent methyltransferase